ncbi:MAG TPA: hypothetical protein VGJ05_11825 [Fimbriiglobus sp.]|jgi:hypothetical protein
MRRLFTATLVAAVAAAGGSARADDATAVLDKAVKALGGADKLAKATAFTFDAKGKISVMGNDSDVSIKATFQGIDHMRQEIELDFGGMTVKGFTVQAGDKGWRKFGDMGGALEGDDLANQKRVVYLGAAPITVLPLKGKGFKATTVGEEKVDGKPAVVLKITGPEGKDFTLSFDKVSGLPAKLTATVGGFTGEDVKQETVYSDYKEYGGIKKATKITSFRDGQKFMTLTVGDFKWLDKVDPKTFTEPK